MAELLGINPTPIRQAITQAGKLLHDRRITVIQTTLPFQHAQQLLGRLDRGVSRSRMHACDTLSQVSFPRLC